MSVVSLLVDARFVQIAQRGVDVITIQVSLLIVGGKDWGDASSRKGCDGLNTI